MSRGVAINAATRYRPPVGVKRGKYSRKLGAVKVGKGVVLVRWEPGEDGGRLEFRHRYGRTTRVVRVSDLAAHVLQLRPLPVTGTTVEVSRRLVESVQVLGPELPFGEAFGCPDFGAVPASVTTKEERA